MHLVLFLSACSSSPIAMDEVCGTIRPTASFDPFSCFIWNVPLWNPRQDAVRCASRPCRADDFGGKRSTRIGFVRSNGPPSN